MTRFVPLVRTKQFFHLINWELEREFPLHLLLINQNLTRELVTHGSKILFKWEKSRWVCLWVGWKYHEIMIQLNYNNSKLVPLFTALSPLQLFFAEFNNYWWWLQWWWDGYYYRISIPHRTLVWMRLTKKYCV